MDIFILAVKELNLTTLPHLQLLINSIINQAYQVKLFGLFASFCKKLTLKDANFRKMLLQSWQFLGDTLIN